MTAGVTSQFDAARNVSVITGTEGADVIIGTDGPDIIHALQGHDIICGLNGDDIIYGGNGADQIFGQSGADTVFGGNGVDTIFAGAGTDTIHGGRHGDTINGGDGNDRLNGNDGPDTIRGGNGADVISGNLDNDQLFGNAGDDTINGGALNDMIDGGLGADTIVGSLGHDSCVNLAAADHHRSCEQRSTSDTTNSPLQPTTIPEQLPFRVACTQADLVNFYQGLLGNESQELADAERRLFELVNETRAICDLDPLTTHPQAELFAQQHSEDMLRYRLNGTGTFAEIPDFPWFGHSDLWPRIAQDDHEDDIVRAGENVAFVSQGIDPVLVHVNLLRSGTHMCNIVHPGYDSMGLGYSFFDPIGDGQIVAQIYAGDIHIQPTSGALIVQDMFGETNTGTLDCWG